MMNDEEKETDPKNQEVWIKCIFDGYFCKFIDKRLCVTIHEENPKFADRSPSEGTTSIFAPVDEKDGRIDLTPLFIELLRKIKEKPDVTFKCYATGFGNQIHLDKDLLGTPIPWLKQERR